MSIRKERRARRWARTMANRVYLVDAGWSYHFSDDLDFYYQTGKLDLPIWSRGRWPKESP